MFEYDPNLINGSGDGSFVYFDPNYEEPETIEAEVLSAETIEEPEGIEIFIADMPELVLTVNNTAFFTEGLE